MKVLYIPDVFDYYGATDSLMQMIKYLYTEYNVVPVIVVAQEGRLSNWAKENGFEYHCIYYKPVMIDRKIASSLSIKEKLYIKKTNMLFVMNCKKIIDFKTIDIIHTNLNRIDVGAMLAKYLKKPHVWHIREFASELDYDVVSLRSNYISYINKHSNKIIFISNVVKNAWIKKGIDNNKSIVIWDGIVENGIDVKHDILENDIVKIVICGYLCKNKGQDQLIKAITLLPEDIKRKIQVDIYGEGDEEYTSYLLKLVDDNELCSIVDFKGYVENVKKLYSKYDMGVVCSKSEGLGRVTIDYMSYGCLVIASKSGANIELLCDEQNGYFYEYNNYKQLANIIAFAINNKNIVKRIADNGYAFSYKNFSCNEYAKKIIDVYNSCVVR